MKNLTTPQAILGGLALIAIGIASLPLSSRFIQDAEAQQIGASWDPVHVKIINSSVGIDYLPSMGIVTVESAYPGFKIRQ